MQTARRDRMRDIFDEVARGSDLDRTLGLIADQIAADLGAPTCKIWVVKRGDICRRCPLADSCPNRQMCMHLIAASGAAIDKEYSRIPLSIFNASLIARGGTSDFSDPNDGGEKLFGLQHGAQNGGRDCYALYPLKSASGTVGLIGVFNHRLITPEEMYALAQMAPVAVAAIRVAELVSRSDSLRYRLEHKPASASDEHPLSAREGELEEAVAQLTRQVAQLQVERDSLLRKDGEADSHPLQLESENRLLRERLDSIEAKGQEINLTHAKLADEIETERTRVAEETASLKSRFATLEQEMERLGELRNALTKELSERDQVIEELRAGLAAAHQREESQNSSISAFEQQVAALEEANASLREQNTAIGDSIDDLERSLRIAEDVRSRLEQDRVALEQRNTEMSEATDSVRKEISRVSAEAEQLAAEHARLLDENARLTSESEQSRGDIQTNSTRISELEQENAALIEVNKQLEAAAAQFESLTARLEESATRLSDQVASESQARAALAEHSQTLAEENLRLKREGQSKALLFANLSHEFRTPMNAIIGFTSMIMEDRALLLSDRHRSNLDRVYSNARDLLELINNVLDLSKIEAGRMDVYSEPADARDLIERSLGVVEPLVAGRALKLSMEIADDLPKMRTDRMKLQQIFINLLSNAIKFTPEGQVKVTAAREGTDRVRLSVSDTGIGIAESDIPKIFEEFRQIGAHNQARGTGTGLGLAITRRLVELLEGEIAVSSRPNEGSVFTVTLPIEIESRVTDTSALAALPSDPDRTALVIDADPASLYLTRKYLSEESYSVAVSEDANRGIEIARLAQPSLITVDLDSLEDGPGIIRKIAGDRKAGLLIAISSNESAKFRAIEAGADLFLLKPVEREELIKALEQTSATAQTGGRVLIVDDDPDALNLAVEMIEGSGYEILKATGGREALEMIAGARPDVIILDLTMPEMDGFEVAHRLSLNADWRDIPIILLTARDLSHDERRALGANTMSTIQKGRFSRKELLAEIKKALSATSEKAGKRRGAEAEG